jgi:predicted membrane chloride channel (bestrophin family)
MLSGWAAAWGNLVVSKSYLTRQATTLIKFAQSTSDPKVLTALVEKAAELKSQADETTPPSDLSPLAPDVEFPTS